mmetsp:Transcript_14239/g.38713  ORF Transcript_14239/g.38713 Transcript_14239/m.38713 type:complete len:221 (-) Transcript_14239:1531-2193(-)
MVSILACAPSRMRAAQAMSSVWLRLKIHCFTALAWSMGGALSCLKFLVGTNSYTRLLAAAISSAIFCSVSPDVDALLRSSFAWRTRGLILYSNSKASARGWRFNSPNGWSIFADVNTRASKPRSVQVSSNLCRGKGVSVTGKRFQEAMFSASAGFVVEYFIVCNWYFPGFFTKSSRAAHSFPALLLKILQNSVSASLSVGFGVVWNCPTSPIRPHFVKIM